jgi:TonB-linked SusC/RagA family outer membrane protein
MSLASRRRSAALALLCLPLAAPPLLALEGPKPSAISASERVATIRGKVIDRESGLPIIEARVQIVGTNTGAITNNDGNFVLNNVRAGSVSLRVSRLGFEAATQIIQVPETGDLTVNFSLGRVAARLEEVVTTATGEQSRREMGNVVARIKADSLVATAPVMNVNELLQARTAGVQVIQGQGVIGASSSIRIRGTSSLSLTNEPLIVVDGVRFDSQAEPGSFAGVRINRFSSMNPEEIESIDIIKGPSASALYGTAAANGVIVISTKKGRDNTPRWSGFAEGGMVSMPAKYPSNYWSWGRNLTGGVPGTSAVQCKLAASALGQCVIDSLTSYNPWTEVKSNPWADAPRSEFGLQVSGGVQLLRYFASVTREDETGPYKMPSFEIDRITSFRGKRPADQEIRPNSLRNTSGRVSFSFPVGKNANLDVTTGYVDRNLWTPFDGTFFAGLSNQMLSAPGYKTLTNGTAREFVGDIFGVQQRTTLERLTTSAAANWQALPWLQLTAEGGVDNANSYNYQIQLANQGTRNGSAWGPLGAHNFTGKDINRSNALQYTVTTRGTANRSLTSTITSQTTVGGQWFRTGTYRSFLEGYGLAIGTSTPNAAQQRIASEFTAEDATYGAFISEQLAWNNRLFWTISARSDRHSAFGENAGTTIYPTTSLSYVISEESWFPTLPGVDRLRLRASRGQAGLPPNPNTAALQFLTAATYPSSAQEQPGLLLASVGNDSLKPEITTETEGGFDLALLRERVNIEFTIFNKKSEGQLFNRNLAPSWGSGATQWINVAEVRNHGEELTVDAQILRFNPIAWTMRVNGSHLKNKLVSIGDVPLAQPQGTRNVVGYPLNGLWDRPYTYNDANNDGIIVPSEITLAAADAYRGSTLPEWEAGFSNTIDLFKNIVSINALFDYRGNFWNSYTIGSNRCVSAGNCAAVNVPGSDLDDQAAAVAASTATLRNTRWGIFQPNDFIRFRELSVAFNAPDRFASRYLRARQARLILSGRNLGVLWTKYPGVDPEANRLVANGGGGNDDLGTPPALRFWTVRMNLNY